MAAPKSTRRKTAWALESRYPGVTVTINWVSHEALCGPSNEYRGWYIQFEADSAEILVSHGLASRREFERRALVLADEFGHSRYVHGVIDQGGQYAVGTHVPDVIPDNHHSEKRVHTKKMQTLVARLLKRAFSLPRREVQS